MIDFVAWSTLNVIACIYNYLGVNKMTKGQDKKKEAKKEPTHKSIKEKRAAKNAKKAAK
jgi:hypothetical protein